MNKIQNKIFEIYLSIQVLCEKYGLRYWAIGGTCLGAVRHKGFIPWDIDMDIAMPDEDFNKFCEIAPNYYSDTKFTFCNRFKGHMVSLLYDASTTGIGPENFNRPEQFIGIHVDIMTFYGMPKSRFFRKYYACFMGFLCYLDSKRFRSLAETKTTIGKIAYFAMQPIKFLTNDDFFFKLWRSIARRYKYDDSLYTCFLWADYDMSPKLILETRWFNDWVKLPFESSTIRCPKDYDHYLKTQYGDYMALPSETEINCYGTDWFFDTDKPYKYYQEHGLPDNIRIERDN